MCLKVSRRRSVKSEVTSWEEHCMCEFVVSLDDLALGSIFKK